MPRYTVGYPDGSGKEYILCDGRAIATTAWGCGCCKPDPTPDDAALSQAIADALNQVEGEFYDPIPSIIANMEMP
jgi:hypothetical protein